MTSVPKPLKFLRPHYATLKAYYDRMADSDLKYLLADVLSVLAMTMSAEGERVLKVFPYPITITTVQFAVGTIFVLFMWTSNLYRRPKISGAQLVAILPLAVVHTLGDLFTNMSLGKVAVSFTHTIKAIEPFFSVVLSAMFLGENLLVLFEELGGDPTKISLMKRSVTSVCADVAEYHPMIKNWHIESYGKTEEIHKPKVHLRCSPGQSISSIKFASFGTPLGTCGSFQQGTCHAPTSYSILEKDHESQHSLHIPFTSNRLQKKKKERLLSLHY